MKADTGGRPRSTVNQNKSVIVYADSEPATMIATINFPTRRILKFAFQTPGRMDILFPVIPGDQGSIFIFHQSEDISHFSDRIKIWVYTFQGYVNFLHNCVLSLTGGDGEENLIAHETQSA